MEIHNVPATVSHVVFRIREIVCLSLRFIHLQLWRKRTAELAAILALSSMAAHGAVTIYAPAGLEKELIAKTTAEYNATVKPSVVTGNWSVTITSKKPVTPPGECLVPDNYGYGFGAGMDEERWENMKLIFSLAESDQRNNKCGGQPLSTSTETMKNACLSTYSNVVGSLQQRWGYVFTSTGGIVQ